jgi:putative PIN family toxin of toxin-antitoxin system
MKSVIFDTNVLLDIFVFNDFRALHLKQALTENKIIALATSKTIEELADVIGRPLFALDGLTQEQILAQWCSLARLIEDENLQSAPWKCADQDDQVFLDLAYTAQPSILVSKDNEILKLAYKTRKDGVFITDNYLAVSSE